MPSDLISEGVRTVESGEAKIPWYLIPFDERGRCTGPATRQELLDMVRAGGFTNIFLFSHGWNNTWKDATAAYEGFIRGFMQMRKERNLSLPPDYKPLLVGVFWPSIILVTSDEKAPQIAAGGLEAADGLSTEQRELQRLSRGLPDDRAERLYELAQRDALTAAEAAELGRILMGELPEAEADPLADIPPTSGGAAVEQIVGALAEQAGAAAPAAESGDLSDFGSAVSGAAAPAGGPEAASWVGDLAKRILPRDAIRVFTVYQMKDRAGVVGARGVAPLLVDLLGASAARVHLIGHSYGSKVVLSATCFPAKLPRKVDSVLLLQPAISHLCFAKDVPKRHGPGGYRAAFERVRLPILSTFSANDFPLTRVFHLAVRREGDLGELQIAAPGQPPSVYAALGGFGPRGAGETLMKIIPDGGARYALGDGAPRVYGLDGTATISGHGAISNLSTWWALYNQLAS
jgi:hypothetical protein